MADIISLDAWRRHRSAAASPADAAVRLAALTRAVRDAVARQRAMLERIAEDCRSIERIGFTAYHDSLAACGPALARLRQAGRDGHEVVRTIEDGDIEACIALRARLLGRAAPPA